MEGRGGGRRGLWLDILVKNFFPLGRFSFLAFLHARPAEHLTNPNPFHTIFFLRSPLALTPPRSPPILKRHGGYSKDLFKEFGDFWRLRFWSFAGHCLEGQGVRAKGCQAVWMTVFTRFEILRGGLGIFNLFLSLPRVVLLSLTLPNRRRRDALATITLFS